MNASVEKQIAELKKMGMEIGDQKKTGIFLLMNNFDYVLHVFGKCFMDPKTNQLRKGSDFNEIMALHHYDGEIRGAMMKTVLICEFHLKSAITNVFNAAHKEPDSFRKASSFDNTDPVKIKELMGKIESSLKNISQGQINNSAITLAVFLNNVEFSVLKKFFSLMIASDRQSVASQFSNQLHNSYHFEDNIKAKELDLLIENIHQLRNTLAHNNPLYGFQSINIPPYFKSLHQAYGILRENPRNDLYNTLLLLQPFIDSNQFAILYNTLIKRSRSLKKNLTTIHVNDVLQQMGFPLNFHESPKLFQGDRMSSL